MINWRSIKDVGHPVNPDITYLVTDGKSASVSGIYAWVDYSTGDSSFTEWTGDDNTWDANECCSGEKRFGLIPTHWCPVNELNLPNN